MPVPPRRRRGHAPGLTRRELIAYRCGRRLAGIGDDVVATIASAGVMLVDRLEVEEVEAWLDLEDETWWPAWWAGWNDANEEES